MWSGRFRLDIFLDDSGQPSPADFVDFERKARAACMRSSHKHVRIVMIALSEGARHEQKVVIDNTASLEIGSDDHLLHIPKNLLLCLCVDIIFWPAVHRR